MKESGSNQNNDDRIDNEVQFVTELDHEAFSVILRLYDKTFRELVDR